MSGKKYYRPEELQRQVWWVHSNRRHHLIFGTILALVIVCGVCCARLIRFDDVRWVGWMGYALLSSLIFLLSVLIDYGREEFYKVNIVDCECRRCSR